MPKTATPRRRYGSTSMFKNDSVHDPATGKTKYVPDSEVRNSVGDQGAEKLKAARKTMAQKDDMVSSSDAQSTPTERKAKAKADRDEFDAALVEKVKAATSQRGGALVRSNYGS